MSAIAKRLLSELAAAGPRPGCWEHASFESFDFIPQTEVFQQYRLEPGSLESDDVLNQAYGRGQFQRNQHS